MSEVTTALATGSPADLLALATEKDAGIEVIERLATLYKDERAYNSKQAFNAAMADAQTEIRPISTDATNPQTRSRYATYAALDRVLRPIYTQHGFGLSFSTADTEKPDTLRVLCVVSHREGHERTYQIDMPADGKGAKGGDVMTKTHATGAAATYGMRYLLKMIFNVAIGEDDNDGNGPQGTITPKQAEILKEKIREAGILIAQVCKFGGVDKLEDFPQAKYDEAIRTCEKHIANGGE